jgi:hypothetical protein
MSNAVRFTRVRLHSPRFFIENQETRPSMGPTDISEVNLNTFSPTKSSPIQGSTNNVNRFSNPHSGSQTYLSIRMNQAAIRSVPSIVKQGPEDSTTMFNISSSSASHVKFIFDPILNFFVFLGFIFKLW